MQRHQQLFTIFTVVSLCAGFADTNFAAKLKFPSDAPAFTVDLPSAWTCKADKDGTLNCDTRDESGWVFSILPLAEVHSDKELNAELPQLAKSMGSGASLKNFKVGNIRNTQSDRLQFSEIKGHGDADAVPFVVVVTGFEAQKGKFFAMISAGSDKADKKHASDYEGIAASLEPLTAGSKGATPDSKTSRTESDAAAGDATPAQDQPSESQPKSAGLPAKYADYMIVPDSQSPDGKFAVMYPKAKLCSDDEKTWAATGCKDYIVAMQPFQVLTAIDTTWPQFENKNHGGMTTTWLKDGSAVLVQLDEKWGPNDIFLYEIGNGKVSRSTNLLKKLHDPLAADCRKAIPDKAGDCSEFVFEPVEDTPACQFAGSSEVRIRLTATTDPKESPGRRAWDGAADATWDISQARFTSEKVTRKFGGTRKD